jgi:hypothetical protein
LSALVAAQFGDDGRIADGTEESCFAPNRLSSIASIEMLRRKFGDDGRIAYRAKELGPARSVLDYSNC